jgi:hypothetical protein
MLENFSHTISNFAGSHLLITIAVALAAGVVVGKLVFGKKKDKKG